MSSLTFKNINKVYPGNVRAVSDFNLDIKHEEFIILIGPSGCGKSTMLRMIAGLEDITEGELYIDEKLVNDVEPKDRDIAMVFQNYALYPHMTVYENMAFGLKMRKMPKEEIEERVSRAADILGINELLGRKPKALSGGQRQRVALGRAIVRSPKVFLMDEPLSNLDAKLRVQTRGEIVKLHKKLGTTFIYVTHDQVEAMTMADKIVVMKDGIIQQFASPQELYQNPANLFVAGFIGSPQMNFLEVDVVENGAEIYLKRDGMKIRPSGEAESRLREKGYVGKALKIGVRPEDVYLGHDEEAYPIKAEVDVIENMGSEKYLYLKGGHGSVTVKAGSDVAVDLGDEVQFNFEANKLHYFDKSSELSI
ncbi:carbohydrate ABC transporter ATP-binding prot ein, CUT1 family (plasmid) [Peptoclostridium acidaminophilum DSM 3953]|uniref:Carbohydrate ABC transporter ATP-binding prot ein, CUT1 family n=1 Tax=Peptoclostridium acidaminophilum DSM 3953 TaxID=1286171 RepID=W8TP17_PEPAC|nr:sn-glycerol-3-phosphate ABC transporter ATP-binding protein UgpC [Peptoclostridium acidaminophilum]AHM57902.1 carbohydrate ABC transporter ATP-binding prot ein, CUT1 family [Peptoclostridium acidaminophilum DSM 3953]